MRLIEKLCAADPIFKQLKAVQRSYPTKCWEWQGTIWSNGYARKGEKRLHRYAYELIYDLVPDGLFALHKCDNKICCRPDHVYAGTHAQNMEDYKERRSVEYSGENNFNSALKEVDVQCMLWLRNKMHMSTGTLIEMFNMSKNTVLRILNRKTWKHVKEVSFDKKMFKTYLKERKRNLNSLRTPMSDNLPNYRNELDELAAASLCYLIGQTKAAKELNVSRNSIRNAFSKHESCFDMSVALGYRKIAKTHRQLLEDYKHWKAVCSTIFRLIEKK